ncbi:MAG: hypothetical protein KDK39_05370 [Leptospiraceae bacterium]|nr:hypothetical protein [Leptospiraceae bacterium]
MKPLKNLFSIAIVFCLAAPSVLLAQSKEISIPHIPQSAADFTTMRNTIATTPEGGAAMVIAALMAFSQDRNLGMQCLTIALDSSNLEDGSVISGKAPARSFNYHLGRMDQKQIWPYLAFNYVKGGTVKDGYAVKNNPPFTVVTSRNKYSGTEASGKVKVFVAVDGFSPRPITLKKNKAGHWKAYELSSVWLDVAKPQAEEEEL